MKKSIYISLFIILIALVGYYLYSTGFHPVAKSTNNYFNISTSTYTNDTNASNVSSSSSVTAKSISAGKLELINTKTYDVTPATNEHLQPWRPEIQKIGDNFYYAFNKGMWEQGGFALITLDQNFKQIFYTDLFSGDDNGFFPTDIRTFTDSAGDFWYAFENAQHSQDQIKNGCQTENKCEFNTDNVAIYTGDSLVKNKTDLAEGCPTDPQLVSTLVSCYAGKEVSDDPTPFFNNGKYYVLARAWAAPNVFVRVYDSNLNEIDKFIIDLSKYVGEHAISQNTVVEISGKPYLIGGIAFSPPNAVNASSSIYAFELSSDLKTAVKSVKLTNYAGDYDMRVTSARTVNNILYLTYMNSAKADYYTYLEAFDINNNFISLGRTKVIGARESNVEVSGDKIYVAYVSDDFKLKLAEYQWGKASTTLNIIPTRPGQTPTSTSSPNQPPQNATTTNPVLQQCIQTCLATGKQPPICLQQCTGGQTPATSTQLQGRCGDGVCGPVEKQNNSCPQDCK